MPKVFITWLEMKVFDYSGVSIGENTNYQTQTICKRHEKHAHEKVRNVRSTNLMLMLVWWRLSNSMHQKMLNVPPLPDFVFSFHARITQAWFLIKLHRNGHYTICALSTVNFWFNLILIWVMMWKFGARHLVKPFDNVTDTTKVVSDVLCIRKVGTLSEHAGGYMLLILEHE